LISSTHEPVVAKVKRPLVMLHTPAAEGSTVITGVRPLDAVPVGVYASLTVALVGAMEVNCTVCGAVETTIVCWTCGAGA
jgi:hypothetical protein